LVSNRLLLGDSMVKISWILLSLIVVAGGQVPVLSFAAVPGDQLKITVVPTEPTLIPFGQITLGGNKYEGPYFVINSLRLNWTGKGNLQIARIRIDSDDEYAVRCLYDF
jgi:hypothetical protein